MVFLLIIIVIFALMAAINGLPRLFSRPRPSLSHTPAQLQFPDGFLWGSGEDAYQHEGSNDNADWYAWERGDPRPFKDGSVSGDCADFWNRWKSDFALAQADGHNAHRIGIEWSRVESSPGVWNEEAWSQYRTMLEDMKRRGFKVFVNLWHFTLPAWAAADGGWESPLVMERWACYVEQCSRRFGDIVDFWSTMIDAQIYVLRGYFLGELPPLKKDQALGLRIFATLATAHVRAYRIIKEETRVRGVQASVGMIWFFARYKSRGNPLDAFVTASLDAVFNKVLLDALWTGSLKISLPGGPHIEERIENAWRSLDWIGVNYYYREVVAFSPAAIGFVKRSVARGSSLTDMGWEIYPQGIHELCRELAASYPGASLVITENGLADATDAQRPRFIMDHVAWLKKSVDEGLPVLGYMHWAMSDNLEWLDGYVPKFGLYRVDRTSMERTRTRSAALFSWIAKNNRLPSEQEFAAIV